MSVAEGRTTPEDRALRARLAAVRRRIRGYVFVEGLAAVVAAAALGLIVAVAVDWFFEPSRIVRLALVAATVVFTLIVFYRRFLSRLFVRISDRSLALLVERRFRDFKDSLVTAIELDPASHGAFGRSLLADTHSEAGRRLATADLRALFDPRPRRRAVAAALLGAALIGGFAAMFPALFQLGVGRLLARTDEPWPRRTKLSIDGFATGERVVPLGADVELTVRADAAKYVPDDVYLRYRTDDGVRDEQVMDREGAARPGIDEHQQYKFTFRGMSSSMTFDVLGGDARLRGLKIRVVQRPQVQLRVACKFPTYTGRADAEIDVTGPMPLPQGTQVAVVATANKPLTAVTTSMPDGRGGVVEQPVALSADGRPAEQFRFDVGRLTADTAVTLRLHDVDGIDNTAQLALIAVVDQPPVLAVARRGLELVATPQARLPFRGSAKDEFGVARLWFEFHREGAEPQQRPLAVQPGGARELTIDDGLELPEAFSSAPLKIGDVIQAAVRGEDNRDLPDLGGGNVSSGDVSTLTIVSDAELLRLLEAREIMFREQFKALIEKVTRSRDGLVAVGASPPANEEKPTEADAVPKNRNAVIVEQTRTREKEQRSETLQVADGFAAIVDELTNNRAADSDRLRERLADDIAVPLRRIGTDLFADYEAKLTKLHAAVGRNSVEAAEIEALRRDTTASADVILVEMQSVLTKMQELESFKEAIDLLKAIIAMQRDIGDRTKKSREDKSRLLD